jgi:hypothetical protein
MCSRPHGPSKCLALFHLLAVASSEGVVGGGRRVAARATTDVTTCCGLSPVLGAGVRINVRVCATACRIWFRKLAHDLPGTPSLRYTNQLIMYFFGIDLSESPFQSLPKLTSKIRYEKVHIIFNPELKFSGLLCS